MISLRFRPTASKPSETYPRTFCLLRIQLIFALDLVLWGCPILGDDGGQKYMAAERSHFGAFTVGTTWTYAIEWVRWGACGGSRVRTIRLEQAAPAVDGAQRLVYRWSDVQKAVDSSVNYLADCPSIGYLQQLDTVLIDSQFRFERTNSTYDMKGFEDLNAMSFFQVKRVPAQSDILCNGKTIAVDSSYFAGENRTEIIDTSACLNGMEESASYVRYLQGVGLVQKRWGNTDEGVNIDFTSITLMEFNGVQLPSN